MAADQDISEFEYMQDGSYHNSTRRGDNQHKSIVLQKGSVLDQMANPAETMKKLT